MNFNVDDIFLMLVSDAYVQNLVDFSDLNGQNCQQNRHQLIGVTDTFDLQHPSPTSMLPKLHVY